MKITLITSCLIAIVIVVLAFQYVAVDQESPIQEKSLEYSITQRWEMPSYLSEISGIAWLPDGTMACVQDEEGVIFIYDLKKEKVTSNINFAGSGDYEGIAVKGETAYVMRSDGKMFEIARFRESGKIKTLSYDTGFSSKNNMETLTLSADGKSLITAPKDRDKSDEFKGLYKIDLTSRLLDAEPTVSIDMQDTALENYLRKKVYKTFSPSDIAVHPKTGQYYVLEGINPKLVILDKKGAVSRVIKLDKDEFSQPEGITFSTDGKLYISNEAGKENANILEVKLLATK